MMIVQYFSLFFISFMKYGYIFGVESTCLEDDCMAELEIQLMILATKDIFLNVVQTGMPFLKQRKKVAQLKHKLQVRCRHCLSLVFSLPFFAKTVPFLAVLQGEADAKGLDVGVIIHTKKPEHEFTLEEYESTFNDFCDMAMQFGFCTLFGVGETTETPPMIKIPRITFCCDDRAVPLEVLLSVLHRS